MIDKQELKRVNDESLNERWRHLRIIRVVVPSGKSAAKGGWWGRKIKRKKICKMKAMPAEGRMH